MTEEQKQKIEELKKTGNYMEIVVVVGGDGQESVTYCDCNTTTKVMVAGVLLLDDLIKDLEEKVPAIRFLRKLMKIEVKDKKEPNDK